MKLLISDKIKFNKHTQNPTRSREDKLISYLCKLKKDKLIDDAILHKIPPCVSTAGVLYGLPMVHKLGCPFRPIVSPINTYNYNLASYLVRILQLISTRKFTIKGSVSLWTRPTRKTTTKKLCARLTLVHCLQTFHLIRQYKFVLTNCMPSPIYQHCPV